MKNKTVIDILLPSHWEAVKEIYIHGIETKNATFQTEAPSWEEWNESHPENLRFVSQIDGIITGWAALSPVSSRCVYAGVMEVSVYVHRAYQGNRIGSQLLERLIDESELNNVWTLQSGIFPENVSSIALHERFKFRKVGYREKIGRMGSVWRDTVLMERRSSIMGQD